MTQRDPGSSGVYERLAANEANVARIMDSDRRRMDTVDKVLEKVEGIDRLLRGSEDGKPGLVGRLDRGEQRLRGSEGKSSKAFLGAVAAGAVVGVKVVFDWMTGGHPSAH